MSALVAIAFVVASAAAEAPVEVHVTLDPPVIPFHKQARYTIIVHVTGDTDVRFPDMVDKFGGLNVQDIRRDTKPSRGDRRRITETYVLDPIWAGTYPIAPAQVLWGPEAKAVVVPSPALRVRDLTEEERAAAERFEANASPISLPKPVWLRWWFWVAVAAGLAAAAGATFYVLRRRRRAERAAPGRPPWEVAYALLRELDERQLPKAGKFEPYYVDLSAILRHYIEDRFQLRAPEQTTPEFLDAASTSGKLTQTHQRLVVDFLRHCDRVKFARYEPTLQEMEQGFEVVLQFVDETVPSLEPAAQEQAA